MIHQTKAKLSDKVMADVLELITIQNQYKPGDKLPNEIEFSKELGVSRTTLREAIGRLVSQGVLEIRRGKGTYVADTNNLDDALGFDNLDYRYVRLYDLYQLRLMIEPQICGMAALNATDAELEEIEEIGIEIQEADPKTTDIPELNRRFHNAIARATHNEFITRLFDNINAAIVKGFNMQRIEQINNQDMILTHKMIVEFLKLRDQEASSLSMKLHLKYSVKEFNIEMY